MSAGFTSDAEIAHIGEGFLACTLPEAEFTHAAHWAATLWLLKERPAFDLVRELPGFIRRFNLSVGSENTDERGYHETITFASLSAAADWLAKAPDDEPLYRVCNALLESPLGQTRWILDYWSKEVLFSVDARRHWVEPDVKPLPFALLTLLSTD